MRALEQMASVRLPLHVLACEALTRLCCKCCVAVDRNHYMAIHVNLYKVTD